MKQSVTINGTEYESRSAAARALVTAGQTISQVVKALEEAGSPMKYQTVYAVTKGADKVVERRAKYRVRNLAKTGRYSQGMLSERVGISKGIVAKILNDEGITVPTAKELAQQAKAKETEKAEAIKAEKKAKKTEKKTKKAEKAPEESGENQETAEVPQEN